MRYGIVLHDARLKEGTRSAEVALEKNIRLGHARLDFVSLCIVPPEHSRDNRLWAHSNDLSAYDRAVDGKTMWERESTVPLVMFRTDRTDVGIAWPTQDRDTVISDREQLLRYTKLEQIIKYADRKGLASIAFGKAGRHTDDSFYCDAHAISPNRIRRGLEKEIYRIPADSETDAKIAAGIGTIGHSEYNIVDAKNAAGVVSAIINGDIDATIPKYDIGKRENISWIANALFIMAVTGCLTAYVSKYCDIGAKLCDAAKDAYNAVKDC